MFLFKTFDLDIMYLWSVWYSLAEIVYLSALRRTGSVVDFAVNLSRGGLGASGAGVAMVRRFNHIRLEARGSRVEGRGSRSSLVLSPTRSRASAAHHHEELYSRAEADGSLHLPNNVPAATTVSANSVQNSLSYVSLWCITGQAGHDNMIYSSIP